MNLEDRNVVITGGASGIGKAVARRFADEGAKVVIADLSAENSKAIADEMGGIGIQCDVTSERDIKILVSEVEQAIGPIDLFFSNAGVAIGEGEHAASASNETWQKCWDIHVMSHVYAARALLPGMLERGDGYLLQMASAAGLLSQIGDAAYTATKHAAVAFAESLAITHADQGLKVSVVCPQYVATPLLGYAEDNVKPRNPTTITPEQAAETILAGVKNETFLILPHEEVLEYYQHRTADTGSWLTGMRRLRNNLIELAGSSRNEDIMKLL